MLEQLKELLEMQRVLDESIFKEVNPEMKISEIAKNCEIID